MKKINIFNKIGGFLSRAKSVSSLFNIGGNDLNVKNGISWDKSDFLQANEISLYLNKSIAKRAEKLGEIEFRMMNKKTGEVTDQHDILELLNQPNNLFSGTNFWALYQKYKDLTGSAYVWLEDGEREIFDPKKVNALHLFVADQIELVVSKEGQPSHFKLRRSEGGDIKYTLEEVLYSYYADPRKPLYGMSIAKTGVRAIQTEDQISSYHKSILENGGSVDGVFNFKSPKINAVQLSELKESYQKQYGSAKKVGMPLFLGGDASYERVGLTPQELSFMEAKGVTLDDICILTGVPKVLLANFTDIKFDNAAVANKIFLEETIKPLMTDLCQRLTKKLAPEGYEITFVNPVPEDKEEKRKDLESASNVYALTTNEKREFIGLDPIKGGDEILVPFNLTELNSPEEKKETKKKDLKSEYDHPLKDKYIRHRYYALRVKQMDKREELFLKELRKALKAQEKRVIDALRARKQFKIKNVIDDVFNIQAEAKIVAEFALPILEAMLIDFGKEAMLFSGSDFRFSLTGEIASWLDKKVNIFTQQINETTFKKLQNQFTQSLADGETRDQLVKRVESTYEKITKNHAETIVRTEVTGATQKGTLEGYKQAGVPIKIWTWAPGIKGGVREEHIAMDGEEVPIGQPFSNGLMHPGDSSGGADEVINCQCVI